MSRSETTVPSYDEATLVDELTKLRRTGLRRKNVRLPTLESVAALLGDSSASVEKQINEAIAAGAEEMDEKLGKAVKELLDAGTIRKRYLKERRQEVAKLLGYSVKHVQESIEPELLKDLAAQLISLVTPLLDSKDDPDRVYLKLLAQAAADLHYTCRAVFFVLVHDSMLTKKGIPLGRSGFPLADYLFGRYLIFAYTVYPMPDPYVGLCFADFFLANGYRHQNLDNPALVKQLIDFWRQGANATPLGQIYRTRRDRLRLALLATGEKFSKNEPLYVEQWSPWLNSIGTPLFDSLQLLRKLGPLIATSGAVAFLLKRYLKLDEPVADILQITTDISRKCYPQLDQDTTATEISHYFISESKDLILKLLPDVAPEEVSVL
jgi:hypothetical protein